MGLPGRYRPEEGPAGVGDAWADVDPIGYADLPLGLFVAATTKTALGPVRVVGVCIPWFDAHVTWGRKDSSRWEEHGRFLAALPAALAAQPALPTILAGGFNQRIPRDGKRVPAELADQLAEVLGDYELLTGGNVPGVEAPLIDHISVSPQLKAENVRAWPGDRDGQKLSDHSGVVADLERAEVG